jgi:hypothetical protein
MSDTSASDPIRAVQLLVQERDELKLKLAAIPQSTKMLLEMVEQLEAQVRALTLVLKLRLEAQIKQAVPNPAPSGWSSNALRSDIRCVGCGRVVVDGFCDNCASWSRGMSS